MREVIFVLRQRAYMLLIVMLALPFIQPVPLPGLSTPLGLAIGLIAWRSSLGQRLLRFLESVLRRRWPAITGTPLLNQFHAIVILASTAILLLPLRIPLSNLLPAWAIFLLAGGLLERNGLFIVLGYVAFAIGAA